MYDLIKSRVWWGLERIILQIFQIDFRKKKAEVTSLKEIVEIRIANVWLLLD